MLDFCNDYILNLQLKCNICDVLLSTVIAPAQYFYLNFIAKNKDHKCYSICHNDQSKQVSGKNQCIHKLILVR